MSIIQIKLKALTEIYTGDVKGLNTKLRLTGIKGSIRWWYETLVRGLGGYACDPTSKDKCELIKDKLATFKNILKASREEVTHDRAVIRKALDEAKICPVCRVFGCTGLGAKVRLDIVEIKKEGEKWKEKGHVTANIKAENVFQLKFISLRQVDSFEEKLLDATIWLIVNYGAIGGKTVLKPSNYNNNDETHHRDYGIIEFADSSDENNKPCMAKNINLTIDGKKNLDDWPDLNNFWFVKGAHINRIKINQLVKRGARNPESYETTAAESDVFHGGYIKERGARKGVPNGLKLTIDARQTRSSCESKKIFSFHGTTGKGGRVKTIERCFGYTRHNELDDFINSIKDKDNGTPPFFLHGKEVKKGGDIIEELRKEKKGDLDASI